MSKKHEEEDDMDVVEVHVKTESGNVPGEAGQPDTVGSQSTSRDAFLPSVDTSASLLLQLSKKNK